jgi:hypothetical protein
MQHIWQKIGMHAKFWVEIFVKTTWKKERNEIGSE